MGVRTGRTQQLPRPPELPAAACAHTSACACVHMCVRVVCVHVWVSTEVLAPTTRECVLYPRWFSGAWPGTGHVACL